VCSHEIRRCSCYFTGTITPYFKKVDVVIFNEFVLSFFGIKLTANQKEWFASDGKELRGSILKGDTRGQAVVQVVSHKNRMVYKQGFYNGKKESEHPCVLGLLDAKVIKVFDRISRPIVENAFMFFVFQR
jgi:hypothetical protein